MTIKLSIAGLLALLATNAWAECPVRVDDTHGIVLTRTQPFLSSLFKATPEGLSEYRLTDKADAYERVSATYLHALAPQDRISNANTVRVEYADPVDGLAELDHKKVWRSAATVLVDGVPAMKGTATKTFLGTEEVVVGRCSYPTWVIEDRLSFEGDDGSYFVQNYAPDLGLIIRTIKVGRDGKPISAVEFDTIASGDG